MASILTGRSWREFQERYVHLPAAFDREHEAHQTSLPICINIKSLEGVSPPVPGSQAEYQISVSLFDLKFKCFFGKQWIGPVVPCGQSKKINYKQNIYFHTAYKNSNILGVIEIIVHTTDEFGKVRRLSCGWGVIRLFKYNEDIPDSSRGLPLTLQTSAIYHGSPRALYFLDDPLEENELMRPIQDCQAHFTVCTHKALLNVLHLLPENVIVGTHDVVPGLVDGRDAGKDKFKKPKLLNTVSVHMEHFSLHLQPYVDKFEEELCNLLKYDRSQRENRSIEGLQVSIAERRLQIGVHNGLCYIEKPQTVLLEEIHGPTSRKPTASPSVRRSSKFTHKRTGSTGSAGSQSTNLVLKNPVQINDISEDPLFAVIFKLEYVIAEPLSENDRRMSLSYARAHTRTVSLRWAIWNPFLHPNQSEIHIGLIGGNKLSPDEEFIYKMPDTDMQEESVSKTAGGLAMFQWSFEGKVQNHSMLSVPPLSYNQLSGLSTSYNGLSPHTDAGYTGGINGSMASIRSEGEESLIYESGSTKKRPPSGKHKPSILYPAPSIESNLTSYSLVESECKIMPTSNQLYAASLQVPPHAQGGPQPQLYPQTQPGLHAAPPPPAYNQMFMAQQAAIFQANMMAQGPESELREMPYRPAHGPTLTPVPLPVGGQGLSRAAYARLYTAGFKTILDRNGEPPEVIDPLSRMNINLQREHADPLQSNEIVFQFLAFSKMLTFDANGPKKNSGSVFFTFQFYRFPQMTTERLLLNEPQNDLTSSSESLPFILKRLEKNGNTVHPIPGYEVRYFVDPTYLKPGEGFLFLQHLSRQILHIDVWDGDSLLQIGSCAVDLKYLCRSGNEAVQTTFELDVIKTDYPDEMSAVSDDKTGVKSPSSHSSLQGKLHLRMANIGHALDSRSGKIDMSPLPSKSQVIVSQTAGSSKYKGGSLSQTANVVVETKKIVKKARAHHLADNREVATLLFSDKTTMPSNAENEVTREGDAEKQRKLARMLAIRQMSSTDKPPSSAMGYRKDKADRTRDLKTIEIYRLQTKRDGILSMLNESITTEHTIFPSFGTTEFFEFVFRNPFNTEQTITVECSDPDLQVVTSTREWRHFKTLGQLPTQLEENMFSKDSQSDSPQLFLRAKETVNIPLRFRSYLTDQSTQPQMPVDQLKNNKQSTFKTGDNQMEDLMQSRVIKVYFKSEENKAVAILYLKVEPQPHVIDQTFRFYHPEQSFLKKAIRLPPFHTLPGNPVGGNGVNKVFVRSSDDNVITDSKATQPGEPHDVFFKVAMGASPQRKRFFIAIYIDPFLSRPIQIWQVYVHSLQRVDLACVEGQTSRFNLLLKGTQASRLVRCYSSNEVEMQLSPNDQFMLAAGAVHELNVAVRCNTVGNRLYYINVVDVEYHQLVRSWLVCVNCRAPIVSRTYDLILPVGGGKGSNKKITYSNPYPIKKSFILRCDHPELLQFKESLMVIDGGGNHAIGLKFLPVMQTGTNDFMVFVNDEEDKNEETFKISATYKYIEA